MDFVLHSDLSLIPHTLTDSTFSTIRQTDRQTYRKNNAFPLSKVFDDMCKMGRWLLYPCFDENRPWPL